MKTLKLGTGSEPEDVSEEDAPIIKYVHSVIKDALEMRASDIHMEPSGEKVQDSIPSGRSAAGAA